MLNGVPRILIIRLSAIGDVVRALPALHALRDRYPNAQIDWAVEQKSQDILEGHPALDRVLVFERPRMFLDGVKGFLDFSGMIRDSHYDVVLDLHGVFKSGWLARSSKAKERYGFTPPRSRELSYLFTNKRVNLVSARMNRIEENLAMCQALGAKRHTLDVTVAIHENIQDEIDAYFADTFQGAKKVVAMHVAVDREEKRWPMECFAELADRLIADGRYEVLLTWGPGQRALVEEVFERARSGPEIAPETPDLKRYAALVRGADLFFGGDTGPMHIASAMGTPVVAVFGGTDPAKHAPLRPPCEVLCVGGKDSSAVLAKKNAAEHLRAITPEMAYDACVRTIRQ